MESFERMLPRKIQSNIYILYINVYNKMQRFPAHLTSENPVVHLLTPIVVAFTSIVVELYFSLWASFSTKSIVLVMELYFTSVHSLLVM